MVRGEEGLSFPYRVLTASLAIKAPPKPVVATLPSPPSPALFSERMRLEERESGKLFRCLPLPLLKVFRVNNALELFSRN